MNDPWDRPAPRPAPGFDGQWADLIFLDNNEPDDEIADLAAYVVAQAAILVPPYGSPERAIYDQSRTPEGTP